jgi:putative nucleotidyltransferase with HDIG domain
MPFKENENPTLNGDGKMNREEALKLVRSKVKNRNLVKHMIATEACMRALAYHFQEDEDFWGLTGLLHDLDYDQTSEDFSKHGFLGAQMLEEIGVDDRIVYAVKAHTGHVEAKSLMDKALFAVDPLTGLIVAATLMHPTKKLSNVDTQFVLNRFKEKRFAAGANRDTIRTCEDLGVSLEDFVTISLEGMKTVADELGL